MSINESIDSSQSDTPPANRSSSRANSSRLRILLDQPSSHSKEALSSQERIAQHSAQLAMFHPEEQNVHNFHFMPNRTTLQSQQVKTSNRSYQALQGQGQEINISDRHVQAQQGQLSNMSNRHGQSQQCQQINMSNRHDQSQQGQQINISSRHDQAQQGQQVYMSEKHDRE